MVGVYPGMGCLMRSKMDRAQPPMDARRMRSGVRLGLNDPRMPSRPRCMILRLYPLRTLGMNLRNDSAGRTLVPPSTISRWNTKDRKDPHADARPSDLAGRTDAR
jgi:hypothetical protein